MALSYYQGGRIDVKRAIYAGKSIRIKKRTGVLRKD